MTRYWASSSVKLTSFIFNLPGGLWPLPYPASEAGRELQQVSIRMDLQLYLCHHLICEGVAHHEAGWPRTQPRLTSWPSAHRVMLCPSFGQKWFLWGLMFTFSTTFSLSYFTSISTSKCPVLHTMVSFFISLKCQPRMISTQPVVMTKMLPFLQVLSVVVT